MSSSIYFSAWCILLEHYLKQKLQFQRLLKKLLMTFKPFHLRLYGEPIQLQ